MKLTYRRCGDYYLPNISIPAEDMHPLGKYGRMRMRYLREHRSLLFNQLLLSGKLMKHLYLGTIVFQVVSVQRNSFYTVEFPAE